MSRLCEGSSLLAVNYRGVEVIVKQGDITEEVVDAIVNPANSFMIMGGGVAGAIKRKGGASIEQEAMSKAPVEVGNAIVTGAGRLKARFVIHAPTMRYPASRIGEENVRLATRAALKLAKELGLSSIAFPGMGTGVGGVPYSVAATAMVDEIRAFIDAFGPPPAKVVLVAYDIDLYEAFSSAVREILARQGDK
ncbi:MAG: macro domain-containing protein [Acidilobus sp.]